MEEQIRVPQDVNNLIKEEKVSHADPTWIKYVDYFIESRLSVSAMARIVAKMGISVSRQAINKWLLKNRKEETSYLRKRRKMIVDSISSNGSTVVNMTCKPAIGDGHVISEKSMPADNSEITKNNHALVISVDQSNKARHERAIRKIDKLVGLGN